MVLDSGRGFNFDNDFYTNLDISWVFSEPPEFSVDFLGLFGTPRVSGVYLGYFRNPGNFQWIFPQ